jgi:hypothetical protein
MISPDLDAAERHFDNRVDVRFETAKPKPDGGRGRWRYLVRTCPSSSSMVSTSNCRYAVRNGMEPVLKFFRIMRPKHSINAGSIWI